jgi:hypothetical protein
MKTQHGIVYSDTSGKFGGGVATKGRYGAVVRMKTKPRQPVSNYSSSQKSRFSGVSAAWRALTAAQILAWTNLAKTVKLSDKMGRAYSPSAFQLFSAYNNNLVGIGKTIISAAPTLVQVPTMTSASLAAASGTPAVTLTYAPAVPADQSFKIFATGGIPIGRQPKASDFRHIGNLVTANSSPFAITSLWQAKYGTTPPVGQVIYVRVVPVIWSSGQAGISFQVSATIAA